MAYIPHEKKSKAVPQYRPEERSFRSGGQGEWEYAENNSSPRERFVASENGGMAGYDQLSDRSGQQYYDQPDVVPVDRVNYYDQLAMYSEPDRNSKNKKQNRINLVDIIHFSRLTWPKRNVWAPIAVLIISNVLVGVSVWQWQNGKHIEMAFVTDKENPETKNQVMGETSAKNKDKLTDYCEYRGGKIDMKTQDGESKRLCQLPGGEACDLEALYAGRCPLSPVVSLLEPLDCTIEKNLLTGFGTAAMSEEKIKDLIPAAKNIKGSLCVVRASDKGMQVDREVELLAQLEKNHWITFSTSIKPERIMNQYYKDSKFLYLDISREPLGGWDGPLASERKSQCAQPAISCFKDFEMYTTITMGVGDGLERK